MHKTAATDRPATGNASRYLLPGAVAAGFLLSWAIPSLGLLDQYLQLIIMYLCINIILALSLNLVNGYMGEFSVGHAGFMCAGAYISSLLSVKLLPHTTLAWTFPLAVLTGGAGAAILGLFIAIPSFRTRGDYLAIVTLAFNMIVKSVIENIDYLGGARGFLGMEKLSTMPWVFFWTVMSVWIIRNFIYSNYGRGVLSIRENEIAGTHAGVNTRKVKLLTFTLSSFFAGVAGALFAHLLQFINPRMFDIIKSTDILVMVYLGGIGSLTGSILGAAVYTILLEVLRPLEIWRMVLMPLVLIFLMLYRPRGMMGLREVAFMIPRSQNPTVLAKTPGKDSP